MSGFMSLANSIIRNNKRKRVDKMKRVERYIGTKSSTAEYNEASDYMLHKIKNSVQEEQRQSRRKTILIFVFVGIILVTVMGYFLFIHQFPKEVPLIFQF